MVADTGAVEADILPRSLRYSINNELDTTRRISTFHCPVGMLYRLIIGHKHSTCTCILPQSLSADLLQPCQSPHLHILLATRTPVRE